MSETPGTYLFWNGFYSSWIRNECRFCLPKKRQKYFKFMSQKNLFSSFRSGFLVRLEENDDFLQKKEDFEVMFHPNDPGLQDNTEGVCACSWKAALGCLSHGSMSYESRGVALGNHNLYPRS